MTSAGNNLNDFSENQLTKFCAVYTIKVNWGIKDMITEEKFKSIIPGVHEPLQPPP